MIPNCPKCGSAYVYEDGELFICPECGFEFDKAYEAEEGLVVIDAHGNRLSDGDDVIVIKDLKFKGGVVKGGTKVKNIRLCEGDHNIDCKVPGIGGMKLKSEFVKKA